MQAGTETTRPSACVVLAFVLQLAMLPSRSPLLLSESKPAATSRQQLKVVKLITRSLSSNLPPPPFQSHALMPQHNIAKRASQFLISSCVVVFVVKGSEALVWTNVVVNDAEMNNTGPQLDSETSAVSTSNSSHNTHTSSSFQNHRTKPTCARCRNHGTLTPVKGHKGSCRFRNCTCASCLVVAEGGRLRAIQLAIWRAVEKQLKTRQGESIRSRETDGDASSESKSDKSRETATPSARTTDSRSGVESNAPPSLHGCNSAQNMSTNPEAKATRNIISPPRPESKLPLRYHQDFENYRTQNTANTLVDSVTDFLSMGERRASLSSTGPISGRTQPAVTSDWRNNTCSTIPLKKLMYRTVLGGRTQPMAPTARMANPSGTNPPPQSNLQLSIPCGDSFANSGPLTTAADLVTDICAIKRRSDPLSSSASTSGKTIHIGPSTCINIAHSKIQPPLQYLQLSPSCCPSFTNCAPQPHAALPRTDLHSAIDGSGSLASGCTSNTTVTNVPSVCVNTSSSVIPPPIPQPQFSHLCGYKFTNHDTLNVAETPGTDFHSIDSLSSSFTSNSTPPIMPSAWMNVVRTPPWQPVTRPSQWSCENLPSYGPAGTSYYDTLIRQYDLNSRYLNGS